MQESKEQRRKERNAWTEKEKQCIESQSVIKRDKERENEPDKVDGHKDKRKVEWERKRRAGNTEWESEVENK